MNGHSIAEELAKLDVNRILNEADTRHQILDRLLHEVLSWPRTSVACEFAVHAGYCDFILKDKAGRAALLIEAKRTGIYFDLPKRIQKGATGIRKILLRTLMTDPKIKKAVFQAVQYCPTIGCVHACVTNGHEFIFFRSFIRGKPFVDVDALVIPSLRYFSENFTGAYNLLGYQGVVGDRSLHKAFSESSGQSRELHFPKRGINHYDSPFQKNSYAKFLEPLAKRYFGEIVQTDNRLMDHCYVFARGSQQVQDGIRARLSDSLSPYFHADGAQEIGEIRSGGKLAQRIARSLSSQSAGDVIILYGGKGAGKSTFLRRLLYFDPPQAFTLHSLPIIIDCLKSPQGRDELTKYLWAEITKALNLDGLLERPMAQLLKLFEDRFALAQVQELSGFQDGSPEYLRERNVLIAKWKADSLYVARRLKHHWDSVGKRAVIAFDNTDQLPPFLQDHCFLSAQNIARDLQCIAIISMREERYCRARTAGVLDAYQNSGFHLAAPDLVGVFSKRIGMVLDDLNNNKREHILETLPRDAPFSKLIAFFACCSLQFETEGNALRRFIQECSRDNTRLALEFFGQFLSSGYTHVEEMMNTPSWTVIEHQVIKPMMVPQRYTYDEEKSLLPNVYQCRNSDRGSHFTTLRILNHLRGGINASGDRGGYWRVDALLDEFESKFGMRRDCEAAIDVILKNGLAEANNRLDCFSVEKADGNDAELIFADEIRITSFGIYTLDYLSPAFTYLDLVSLDCGLSEESLCQQFCKAATDERRLAISYSKLGRLDSRLKRVEDFIAYLHREEAREKNEFLLADGEEFIPAVDSAFQLERPRVLSSAKRNFSK